MPLREIVEAGAGCGKTTGLVDRYVAALGLHKNPELTRLYAPSTKRLPEVREILALTFTNEAARQMQERILKRLSDDGHELEARTVREDSQISTYHSFCLRVLQPYLVRRGFEGPLMSPALAAQLRREYLLGAISEYPRATELRQSLNLASLLTIGTKLWFHPLNTSPAVKLRATYEELAGNFESFRRQTLERAEAVLLEFQSREKKPGTEGWIHRLVEALREPTEPHFAALNFSKGPRWVAKENPELRDDAQDLREFFAAGYASFLVPEFREAEIQAQELLWEFMRWALPRAPKIFDFEAAEQELLALLREAGSERLVSPPRVILVDEFQDTNSVQFEILERISSEDSEWYFVGDPKQSIYAFRGGDVHLFYRLRSELSRRELGTNYRSHTQILELVNRLQPQIFRPSENSNDPEPQILKWPAEKSAGEVSMHWLSGRDSTLRYTRDLLLQRPHHFETASTAVLFRSWKKLYAFAELLRQTGLKFRIAGSENPFEHLLTDMFCSYLISQDSPENFEGFWALERWKKPESFSWKDLPHAKQLSESYKTSERGWSSSFQRFCESARIKRFEGSEAWAAAMERWLTERAREGFAARLTRSQLALWIQKHRSTLESENPYRVTPDEPEHPSLTLLTLHASKGLEFRHVYLPELFERQSAHREDALEGDEGEVLLKLDLKCKDSTKLRSLAFEIERNNQQLAKSSEEKRLLYVALTRAIETLHIVGHTASTPSGESRDKDPLRVVGLSKSRPSYWHESLQSLNTEDFVQTTRVQAQTDLPIIDTKTPAPWAYPLPYTAVSLAPAPRSEFHRCGVSRYLKIQSEIGEDQAPARKTKHARSSFDFLKQNEVGTDFHALLEVWNGDETHLEELLKLHDPRTGLVLSRAAMALRQLPALAAYWEAVISHPERVQREFGVFLLSDKYRLSGFADVVWFHSKDEVTLIDWKSGASMKSLRGIQRIEKFREQLHLYANGFGKLFPRIRAEVYGIELGEKPEVAQILSEEILI